MKSFALLFLVLGTVAAQTADGRLEFVGVVPSPQGGVGIILADTSRRASSLVAVGESYGGYLVSAFDPLNATVILRREEVQLVLKQAGGGNAVATRPVSNEVRARLLARIKNLEGRDFLIALEAEIKMGLLREHLQWVFDAIQPGIAAEVRLAEQNQQVAALEEQVRQMVLSAAPAASLEPKQKELERGKQMQAAMAKARDAAKNAGTPFVRIFKLALEESLTGKQPQDRAQN